MGFCWGYARVILGLYWGNIRAILGLYSGYILRLYKDNGKWKLLFRVWGLGG